VSGGWRRLTSDCVRPATAPAAQAVRSDAAEAGSSSHVRNHRSLVLKLWNNTAFCRRKRQKRV
jgi:hypothetical protein